LEEHFLINQNFTMEYFPNTDIIQKLAKNWQIKLITAHSCFFFIQAKEWLQYLENRKKNILFYRFSLLSSQKCSTTPCNDYLVNLTYIYCLVPYFIDIVLHLIFYVDVVTYISHLHVITGNMDILHKESDTRSVIF
jgi:hypothetical protein